MQFTNIHYDAQGQMLYDGFSERALWGAEAQPSTIPGVSQYALDHWDSLTEEQQYLVNARRSKPEVERLNLEEVPGAKEYYAQTAYRGSVNYPTDRKQPSPLDPSRIRIEVENTLGNDHSQFAIIEPLPHCEEYLGRCNFSLFNYVNTRNKTWNLWPRQNIGGRYAKEREKKESYFRSYLEIWAGTGWIANLKHLEFLIFLFLFCYIAFWVINFFSPVVTITSVSDFISCVLLPFAITCVGWYMIDLYSYFSKKNKIEGLVDAFNRKTGMAELTLRCYKDGKKSHSDVFFGNFFPRWVYKNGYREFCISNSKSLGGCTRLKGGDGVDGYLNYYLLCHFMDIERPLPDIPELEAYRYLDPVTAEYDRRTNRPARYWRDKSYWEIKKMARASRQRALKILVSQRGKKLAGPVMENAELQNPQLVKESM